MILNDRPGRHPENGFGGDKNKYCIILVFFVAVLMLAGCFWKKNAPPPEPEPTRVVIEIETTGDINPNIEGQASPLVLRIYQLKGYKRFHKADFLSLYNGDEGVLGSDLIDKQDVVLKPNEKQTIFIEPEDAVRTIGFLAEFRDYEKSEWRGISGVVRHKFKQINIDITGTTLTIQ